MTYKQAIQLIKDVIISKANTLYITSEGTKTFDLPENVIIINVLPITKFYTYACSLKRIYEPKNMTQEIFRKFKS